MDIELDKECLLKYKSLIRTCHFLDKTNCLHPCYFDPMQTHLKFLFSICTFKFRITNIHNLHQFTKLLFQNKTIKFLYHRQSVSQIRTQLSVCIFTLTHYSHCSLVKLKLLYLLLVWLCLMPVSG